MSWIDIAPVATLGKRARQDIPVEFSVSLPFGPSAHEKDTVAMVTLRTVLIEDCPNFLRAGASVRVLEGTGKEFGMLRIVPGAGFRIGKAGGKCSDKDKPVLLLRFPRPRLVLPKKCVLTAEFDYGEDWLEVTMPECVRDALPLPAGTKPPFKSAIADVPHVMRRAAS